MGGNQEAVATSQITAEQAVVATNFMSQIQLYLHEIPLASILISFVIFFIGGYVFIQFVLCCHWSRGGFRNRFPTVFNANHHAFDVSRLCWFFNGYE